MDTVVVRCVNSVGININTASKSLLGYVSGIGEKMAENIVAFRSKMVRLKTENNLKKCRV
ncbi:helix-hairpin-helix domain-containing protein [Flavobacterium paronense]|uniref:helix-hairpin-helix domain-containing protein n=1 Tax=Flavobacterium paronense TaxID=1392775 RepID=UPI003F6D9395